MKNIMRSLLTAVLTLTLILTLCACGGNNMPPAGGSTSGVEATQASVTQAPVTQAPEVQRGTVTGNVYTNDFTGFTFTAPEGWVYKTDNEIAEKMNVAYEMMNLDEFKKIAAKMTSVYDMMIANPTTGNNLNVGFENLALSINRKIEVETYFNMLKNLINESMAGIATYTFGDLEEVALGKTTYQRSIVAVDMSGVQFEQAVYLKKQGKHMIVVTYTSFDGKPIADFETMFS